LKTGNKLQFATRYGATVKENIPSLKRRGDFVIIAYFMHNNLASKTNLSQAKCKLTAILCFHFDFLDG
jgi:hypothetical protein